jgi:hypothetical protein
MRFAPGSAIVHDSAAGQRKGTIMPFKPNYGMQRADRNRAAKARSEEKQKKRDEKAAQRKAERAAATEPAPDEEKAKA